ncbi:ABC transporter permease [Halorussus halobius]|uniref:ABC transporter permease n=1 Tax=Halorussus halobius TaxID=1710537 RepID=UPI00109201CE|nr:ABC transporter permease [Halorussus halobius]
MNRIRYLLRRLVLSIPVVWLGTTATFLIIRLGPLNPAAAIVGPTNDPQARQQLERIEAQLGLTDPIHEQYLDYMVDLLTLDLGQSWVVHQGQETTALLAAYGPRTVWLGLWAVLIPLFVGVPLGMYAGLHPNTNRDYAASMAGIVWRAMPNFWLAVILLALLSRTEAVFFGSGWEGFLVDTELVGPPDLSRLGTVDGFLAATKKILPPALVLGSASMGNELRLSRTAVLETIHDDYVDTMRAIGVSKSRVVWKHVLRNAMIPLIPIVTSEAYLLVGGSVLVEVVFGINGIGTLFYDALTQGDLPLAGSLMYVFILLTVSINIAQDVLYTVIDPRVGYEGER